MGVKGGAEAAAHAARRYLDQLVPGKFMIKLDFSNAFNTLRRDAMLEAIHKEVPEIFNFCLLAYEDSSVLCFQGHQVASDEGNQQGDPLGPPLSRVTLSLTR